MTRPKMYVSWSIGDALEPNPFGSTEPVRAKTSGAPLRVYTLPLSLPYHLLCQLSHKATTWKLGSLSLIVLHALPAGFRVPPRRGAKIDQIGIDFSLSFLLRVNDLQYADRGSPLT